MLESNTQFEIEHKKNKTKKSERGLLLERFSEVMNVNHDLDRSLVSFQANKKVPFFRWIKYREGFSSELVKYLINKTQISSGTLLDPFAGSGTTLFEGERNGFSTTGIELLPFGEFIIRAKFASENITVEELKEAIAKIKKTDFSKYKSKDFDFKHISITEKAFTKKTEDEMSGYRSFIYKTYGSNENLLIVLELAALSILEEISFTRKDGQYLRWDYRSGRSQTTFDKGVILEFKEALFSKLDIILNDLSTDEVFTTRGEQGAANAEMILGSCIYSLPKMTKDSVDLVITSPPYCNRYDYTRTYALELAYLNCDNEMVKELRQAMLSCTVENREKVIELKSFYREHHREADYEKVMKVFENEKALVEILGILETGMKEGALNNKNIFRMVKNYFLEMCFVIYEMSRVVRAGGKIVMVNDNVQYLGEEVPVDLILSSFALSFGLNVDHIWVLPRGKGNSSQQMAIHGRQEIRKCIYVWRK